MNKVYLRTDWLVVAVFVLCMVFWQTATSQFQIDSNHSFGGTIWEELNSIQQTADGGYILTGYTSSSASGDVSGINNGTGGDYWVAKVDAQCQIEWENNFGGSESEHPWKILPTADNGYLVAGYSFSDISGDRTVTTRGLSDYWVVKLDNAGNKVWDNAYGGDNNDYLYDMIELPDGGFLLGGESLSGISGEKSEPNLGNWDIWLVKIEENGAFLWDQTIGGNDEDLLNVMQMAPDGNVLLAGGTNSEMGLDVTVPPIGDKDYWFVKVNASDGSPIWDRRYGGLLEDEIHSFVQTADGGFLLAGGTRSDVFLPHKTAPFYGVVDMWIVKTDAGGTVEWDRSFGGTELENCYSASQNSAGFYVLGGFSNSPVSGNKETPTNGSYDYWILYLDSEGNKKWETSIGGTDSDVLEHSFQNADGGFVLAGHSSSDVGADHTAPSNGLNDIWIVKTACDASLQLDDLDTCPNEPVVLNAFNTNCNGCCAWQWEDTNSGDSIRTVTIDVTTTYHVTLTDDVGCTAAGSITVNVFPTSVNLNLPDSVALCNGQAVTLDAENPGNNYLWSTGETTQTISVINPGMYKVTVSDNNNCTFVDSTEVIVDNAILVNLGPDTSFCSGGSITLDAGNPGLEYLWSPGLETSQTLVVTQPGNYSVVVDNNGCTGTDEVVVSEYEAPYVVAITLSCNDTNTWYTVVLEVAGGDVSTYAISGGSGTWSGNIFTSDPIPKDVPFTFFLDDAEGCGPEEISGVEDCNCTSSAGSLLAEPLVVCGTEQTTATIVIPPVTDANDVVVYVLHTGMPTGPAAILATADVPEFGWQSGMDYGVVYYITALAGNDDGFGNIMLQDGCLSISNTIEVTFYELPVAEITPLTSLNLSCDTTSLIISGASSQDPGGNPLQFSWVATNGGNIMGATDQEDAEVNAAGDYMLIVNIAAGCADTAFVEVTASADLPVVDIVDPAVLTCTVDQVVLDASGSSTGIPFEAEWTGGALTGSNELMPSVAVAGTYTLTITNTDNGCSAFQSVVVSENVALPDIDLPPEYYLDCVSQSIDLAAIIGPPGGNFQILWTSADGMIDAGADSPEPTVTGTGLYQIEVIDLNNGCPSIDNTQVLPNENAPSSAGLTLGHPNCLGETTGSIAVDTVQGGVGPFLFQLDGGMFSADPLMANLASGQYELVIQDAMGCQWDTVLTIDPGSEAWVHLADSAITVELGDELQLHAITNQTPDSILWISGVPLSCTDCLDPWLIPLDQMTVGLEVVMPDGCVARDEVEIVVTKERRVFLPNAFSPNGDGANDLLTIYPGKGVQAIRSMKIFNRWGGVVYEITDMPILDQQAGWDGKVDGKNAASGVYVVVAELLFIDGLVLMVRGDVTLVR